MNSGDIFEFKGERFVARTGGESFYASKLVLNDRGEERPTVGKPRMFKDSSETKVVDKYALPQKSTPRLPKQDEPETSSPEYHAPTEEEIAAEEERNRNAVAKMIEFTGLDEDWGKP